MRPIIQLDLESGPIGLDTGIALHIVINISRSIGSQVTCCLYSWFSEQVGLAGDLGSTSDVLIPWVKIWTSGLLVYKEPLSIARPKIDDKAHFELKGQFLKELPDNTFSGSDNEDANEHIEKVLEIVDLFHIPEVTQDQIMLRVFPMSLTGAASRWLRNEPFDKQEVILFYKELDVPTRQILDSKGVVPSIKAVDAKKAIQDMADHSQKWHNGTIILLKKKEKHLKKHTTLNLEYHSPKEKDIKQLLRDSTKETMEILRNSSFNRSAIRNQGPRSKLWNVDQSEMSSTSRKGLEILPSSTEINPRDHVKSISTTAETKTPSIRRIKPIYEEKETLKRLLMEKPKIGYQIEASMNVHDSAILEDSPPLKEKDPRSIDKFVIPLDLVVLDMLEDIKVPLILERPFLSTAHTKIDVFKRKFTLRVRGNKILFKSDKPTSNIIKRVYALQQRERIEPDLQARLLGEALILNRSLDPTYGDYIKLNDLNEPLELRRNQVEDLGPTIKDDEVIDKPMIEDQKLEC
ncbi:hypothetical protein Tco_0803018 [Tanacetum coccineum]|uniref:Reverse transcriptase domain-containing protein n=1 Tax=Tanacetum coccineum TaxID=301880 RepID=A0ABQ5A1B4_9ASTR